LNENGTAKSCTARFTGMDFSGVPNTDKWEKTFPSVVDNKKFS